MEKVNRNRTKMIRALCFFSLCPFCASFLVTVLCVFGVSIYQPALADEVIETDFVRISLISGSTSIGQSNTFPAGLLFQLEPGWKVYWRSPGEAGLPPQFKSDAFRSSHSADLRFPVPERFSLFGLDTFGYGGDVILPLAVERRPVLPKRSDSAVLAGDLEALICSDICVPVSGRLSLQLPEGTGSPSTFAQQIARAVSRVPSDITGPDIRLESLSERDSILTLRFADKTPEIKDIFIETEVSGYSFGTPKIQNDGSYQIKIGGTTTEPLAGKALQLTITSGSQFAEQSRFVPALDDDNYKEGSHSTSTTSFLAMILTAFLGGMILNVMPCVLPVLTIKLAGIAEMGGQEKTIIRRRMLATALGILASFVVLAGGLILLQSAGHSIGWGIQFQNPYFLCFMSIVMLLFSLSLFDKITVPIPAGLARVYGGTGLIGEFSSGFLVTLLATPCSAPFVGTAVSFALASPPAILFGILTVMGTGLAVPYLLAATTPQFLYILPRPGHWMVRVKQLLGSGLVATLVWLLWLVYINLGEVGLLVLAGCLVILFFSVGVLRSGGFRIIASCTALFAALLMPPMLAESLPSQKIASNKADGKWERFSLQALEGALLENKRVFVDVTADWCVTCKLNKTLVLDSTAMKKLLQSDDIVSLQADWTLPDEEISSYLYSFGRFGIPFNVVYGPGKPDPIILPELLSSKDITSALEKTRALP